MAETPGASAALGGILKKGQALRRRPKICAASGGTHLGRGEGSASLPCGYAQPRFRRPSLMAWARKHTSSPSHLLLI